MVRVRVYFRLVLNVNVRFWVCRIYNRKTKGPVSDGPITTAFNFNNLVSLVTFQHSTPLDSNFTSAIR